MKSDANETITKAQIFFAFRCVVILTIEHANVFKNNHSKFLKTICKHIFGWTVNCINI